MICETKLKDAIGQTKAIAATRLALAETKLAKLIEEKEASQAEFKKVYCSLIKAQEYVCAELRSLSA